MTRRMSSPSSSSSGTAGARRSSPPSRSTPLSWVAAALVAATLCVPFALLFVAGPVGVLAALVGGVAAVAFYFRVAPPGALVPVLSGVALDVGAFALTVVVGLGVGTWTLLRP